MGISGVDWAILFSPHYEFPGERRVKTWCVFILEVSSR